MARFTALLAILTGLAAATVTVSANAAQDTVTASQLCDQQTARQERRKGIPRLLLKAISLAETGRWDKRRQAAFAWPWTVMALGQGRYFPTKQAALDYIYQLRRRGVGNIDVGCMQVNLYYHGKAFASIEQALDPATNTAYAADLLKSIYATTRSWTQAAAVYHSNKPDKARAYKLKVLKYWNASRRAAKTAADNHIDYARMAQLNRHHRAGLKSAAAADPAQLRRGQLAAWRNGDPRGLDLGQLAAVRRASLESKRRRLFLNAARDDSGKKFAAKRRRQLKGWRKTGLIAGS